MKKIILVIILIMLAIYGTTVAPVLAAPIANLVWSAPSTYADGLPLPIVDIAGYKIYYGESSGNYTGSIDVPNTGTPTITSEVSLPTGRWFFSVTVVKDITHAHASVSYGEGEYK